ncbi:MAG: hypothetical protein ACRCZ2_10070 [Fusobacteriaceae bacterium]
MSIDEMFAHYVECENDEAVNRFINAGVDDNKQKLTYPYAN